jgi:hypothetical protein
MPRVMERSRLDALHQRLLMGDLRAGDEVAEFLLRRVAPIVRARRRGIDQATAEQAVLDAVTDYLLRLSRFDPQRSSLLTWVALAAIRNVDDARRTEATRRAVEDAAAREWDRARPRDPKAGQLRVKSVLYAATHDRAERKFVVAWLKRRPIVELAEILGVSGLPQAAMQKAVRRTEERLRLRLKRAACQLKERSDRRG